MNVKVTTFTNPFSFFCVSDNNSNEACELLKNAEEAKEHAPLKNFMSDVNHGQYVLVMWNNKWSRGVVDMQTQFLIWLIDYGIFIRPNDKTIYIDLPSEYKKYPTKVFEASLHGVVPIHKVLSVECEINTKRTKQWSQGSVERVQLLLGNATKTVFYPLAVLSTKYNDIVLGDLILYLPESGKVNLIDELEKWPAVLEQDQHAYVEDLLQFYNTRRLHRANILKPSFPNYDLPYITIPNAHVEYIKIVNTAKSDLLATSNSDVSNKTDGTFSTAMCEDVSAFKITPEDMEKYSKRHISINGRSYNVLNILINKARDLRMCELYKDYDRKSVGRASYYSSRVDF